MIAGILTTPLLGLRHATVYGTSSLTSEEALAVEKASNLPPGLNTLFLNARKMEAKLNGIPAVKSSRVSRTGVNSIGIAIVAREPFALLIKGKEIYEADYDGIPIRPTRLTAKNRLPLIRLPGDTAVSPGTPLSQDSAMSALQILKNAHYHPLIRIVKIDIDQTGNLCLNMMDGIAIQFGLPENIPAKMEFVQKVYQCSTPSKKVVSINISCLEHPVCVERSLLPVTATASVSGAAPMEAQETKFKPDQSKKKNAPNLD